MSKNVLLISAQTVKDRSAAHLNLDDKLIMPEIKAAQDTEIEEALGSRLFSRLQDAIESGQPTDEETLLLEGYITDALVNYTLAGVALSTPIQFYTKGPSRKTDQNADTPSMSDLIDVSNFYKNRGAYYRDRLIRYLQGSGDTYPLYREGSCNGSGAISDGYEMPCWLPD